MRTNRDFAGALQREVGELRQHSGWPLRPRQQGCHHTERGRELAAHRPRPTLRTLQPDCWSRQPADPGLGGSRSTTLPGERDGPAQVRSGEETLLRGDPLVVGDQSAIRCPRLDGTEHAEPADDLSRRGYRRIPNPEIGRASGREAAPRRSRTTTRPAWGTPWGMVHRTTAVMKGQLRLPRLRG